MQAWGMPAPPTAAEIYAALFPSAMGALPLEWARLSVYQDNALRLLVERVLSDQQKPTRLQSELSVQEIPWPACRRGSFHVFVSKHCPGSLMLMSELAEIHELQRQQSPQNRRPPTPVPQAAAPGLAAAATGAPAPTAAAHTHRTGVAGEAEVDKELLHVTTDIRHMSKCAHMLVYLTAETWGTDGATEEFIKEVARARELGIHLLVVHELPDLDLPGIKDTRQCRAAKFETLVSQAPKELIDAGIFAQIILPLKPEPYRHTSMVLLMQAITDVQGDDELARPSESAGAPRAAPPITADGKPASTPTAPSEPVPMWMLSPAHKSTQRLVVATREVRAEDLRKAARDFYKSASADAVPPRIRILQNGVAPPPLPPVP